MWATSWQSLANEMIGPAIGLPVLPYVDFGAPQDRPGWDRPGWRAKGISAKLWPLANYAACSSAWIDDEISETDVEYLAACYPAPALALCVSPITGIRRDDFAVLAGWASGMTG